MQVCTENCDTAAITSPGIGVASDGVLRFTIPVQAGRPALDPEHPPGIHYWADKNKKKSQNVSCQIFLDIFLIKLDWFYHHQKS